MSRNQNMSGVWKFLEMSGVLDTGSEEEISKKRLEYWNMRKRISKQEKHKSETEFKIYLNSIELPIIAKSAKAHKMSRTRFIKQAALAYTTKQYIVPDQAAINHITQLLALNYSLLQEISETMPFCKSDVILEQISALKKQVIDALCNPETKLSVP